AQARLSAERAALAKAESEAQARAAAQARAETEAKARAEAEAEAEARAQAAQRARLAAEAKIRQEADARARQAERARAAAASRAMTEAGQGLQAEPLDVSSAAEPDATARRQAEAAAQALQQLQARANPERQSQAQQSVSWDHVSRSGDTLWAIARKIQRESGGRIVDIVNALHQNNRGAFISNDADRLRIDAQLNVSLAQIKAVTPATRRSKYWPDSDLLAANDDTASAADAAGETARPDPASARVESANAAASQPAPAQLAGAASGQPGVLSLVTRSESTADLSPLTRDLSRELEENSAVVNAQISSGMSRAESVESRMDNILAQYDALSEKTAQLKELEATLNRRIAEKAQVDLGLAGLPAPDVPGARSEGLLPDRERSLWWWLQWLVMLLGLAALVWGATLVLRRRHEQRRSAYVDSWDNDLLRSDRKFSDAELAEMVKLKGERLPGRDDAQQHAEMLEEMGEGGAELQASLYIAYERYEDAEKLLADALREQPANQALKNQLLEVYAALGKTEAYQQLADEIAAGEAAGDVGKVQSIR
ncbi:MAG: hypothetical protein WBN40_12595, partial [Pseudomonadales bacterium]